MELLLNHEVFIGKPRNTLNTRKKNLFGEANPTFVLFVCLVVYKMPQKRGGGFLNTLNISHPPCFSLFGNLIGKPRNILNTRKKKLFGEANHAFVFLVCLVVYKIIKKWGGGYLKALNIYPSPIFLPFCSL